MALTLDDILSTDVETLPVLLVDSDTLAFRSSSATDGRQYKVRKTSFKYKADAVAFCIKEDIPVEEAEIMFFPEPLPHALHIMKSAIKKIEEYGSKKYGQYLMEFYHTGHENFRKNILPDYKIGRVGTHKPFHLEECKQYVRSKYVEFTTEGLEADDLIGMRSYELRNAGREFTIISNDKDMKTLPGDYRNWVDETDFTSTKVEAMKFFYAQCIGGDNADDIPGVDGLAVNTKGTGKAQKIIQAAHEDWVERYSPSDVGPDMELEEYLYNVALNAWLDGGPGKKGSYGCNPLWKVEEAFKASAQCLLIMHYHRRLWQPPVKGWVNYD